MIRRDRYLNQLISARDDGFPKVIIGIRRCGKSYLLKEIYKEYLIGEGVMEEVEKLLLDPRDICIKEEKYHTSDSGYSYDVNIYWVDPQTDMITSADGNGVAKITASTTDEELKMDAFPKSTVYPPNAGPAKLPHNADGFILQCGPSRQNLWKY